MSIVPTSAVIQPAPIGLDGPHARDTSACAEPPAATAADAAHKGGGLEILRLVACLGIIWFHVSTRGRAIGYAGLPALMALSVALAASGSTAVTAGRLIRKRARRLLLPWIFWSAVYAILKVGDAIHGKHPISDEFHRWMLFTGPEIHLWYLPFAFIVTVLAALPWLRRSRLIGIGATRAWTIAGVITLLLISWLLASQSLGPPWAQWAFVVPSVCFGMAFSRIARGGPGRIGWGIAAAALLGCVAAYWMGWGALVIPYAVGVTALALACALNFAAGPWTLWLGGLAYGIYIVHPLFATCISRSSGLRDGTLLALAVALASLAATAILKRTPLRMFI